MAIKKQRVSPRQKMINLMYVVLMAMLALNVSSDVLDAFGIVDDGLVRSTKNSAALNSNIYGLLKEKAQEDPEHTRETYANALRLRAMADSICNFAEQLKQEIVCDADGDDGDINNIEARDNLESASHVMLAPGTGKGEQLRKAIETYRNKILQMVSDKDQRILITNILSTDVPPTAKGVGKNWQEHLFENTPVSAAITILSKLQNDIRHTETQVLHELINNNSALDDIEVPELEGPSDQAGVHVNKIDAYVIPNSRTVVRGGKFSAQVVVGSIDTQNHPNIYVGNTLLHSADGLYETTCNSTGTFTFRGYVTAKDGDGNSVKKDFALEYTVVEPAATVSADLMNVLYAGFQNPMSVSVPGIPLNQVSMSMSGGSISKTGEGKFVATPSKVGEPVTFTVSAVMEGHTQTVGQFQFKVRKLPDPTAYIEYRDGSGTPNRYKGGGRGINKGALLGASGLSAAIDDGLLDIPFKVTSFKVLITDRMGNYIPAESAGGNFSDSQKNLLRQLGRGKRFFITDIQVIGPDGISRKLDAAMPGIVN